MSVLARIYSALRISLKHHPVRYYVCCACDRVYQIDSGFQIWQSTLDLSEQLAQFRQSDCARYEEYCGQCCEGDRQRSPKEHCARHLVRPPVEGFVPQHGPHSRRVGEADEAHSQGDQRQRRSVDVDVLQGEGRENKRHSRKADDTRPTRICQIAQSHWARLTRFLRRGHV